MAVVVANTVVDVAGRGVDVRNHCTLEMVSKFKLCHLQWIGCTLMVVLE